MSAPARQRPYRSNGMPLVHQARRLRQLHAEGNPFATKASLEEHLGAMAARYMEPRTSDRVCQALHVEMDLLAEVLA